MASSGTVTPGFTFDTTVELTPANLNALGAPGVTINSVSSTEIIMENYAVAGLPTAGNTGRIVFCSDGDAGNPCMAVDNGTDWKVVALGATVSDGS